METSVRKNNILIVDDLPDNVLLLESLIENDRIKVFTANSGKAALDILQQEDFALMLLDVQMPEMDGFQVAEITRNLAKTKFVPIIFITAISTDLRNIYKGYSSGAIDYLSKPIEPEILLSKVNLFVDLYEQRREIQEKNEMLEMLNSLMIEKNAQIEIQNIQLYEKQHVIEEAYHLLELKNRDVTDSIRYARRIQQSIIPSEEEVQKLFPNSFVFFKPKAIVSGDFYWIQQHPAPSMIQNEKQPTFYFLSVVDCTGHGVPGALLSIVGSNLLNRALRDYYLITPSEILDELNNELLTILSQSSIGIVRDGMELALIRYEPETKILEFAGARRPMYLIRNNEIIITEGDKASIGYDDFKASDFKYKNHTIQIENGDVVYLFSDGYPDQFGGADERKFSYKAFREMLLSMHSKSIAQQKAELHISLKNWRGTLEQIDDICIVGIMF